MSHLKKLEQVLDLLINEETDQATDLLHDIVVEKARQIYEDLVDDETMGEEFGGDVDTDYADEVAQSEYDIDTDELQDVDQEGSEGEEMPEEEELEDRLEDLEGQFAELQARFAELAGEEESEEDEEGEEVGDEFGDDFSGEETDEVDGEEGEFEESMYEATKLSNDVSIDMKGEGKLVGTGNKSKAGATNTKSPIARKPEASYAAGNVIKTGKATGAGKTTPLSAKKDDGFGSKGNIKVKTGNVSVDLKGEGKPVGTGKGAPRGSVNAKPILPKK